MKNLIYLSAVLFFISCNHDRTIQFANPSKVHVGGILGNAIDSNENGRLKWYIQDEKGETVRIFNRDSAKTTTKEGWMGEFTGKWLYAASRCAIRTHDKEIMKHVKRVADFLVSQQDTDGYLGTYNDTARF